MFKYTKCVDCYDLSSYLHAGSLLSCDHTRAKGWSFSNLPALKENARAFQNWFMTSSWPQIAKLKVNFLVFFTVKSFEICHTGYILWLELSFYGNLSYKFLHGRKNIYLQKSKKKCYQGKFLFYFFFIISCPAGLYVIWKLGWRKSNLK